MEFEFESEADSMEIDSQESIYTIQFEKTKTTRGLDAILVDQATFVFKHKNKNIKNELGYMNANHTCDMSNIEHKCKAVEIRIINRAIEEDTSLPKVYQEEQAKLIESGYDQTMNT
ncbi:unnamed protein product [Brachionus calyciflorus]|uniref:Uncharacterized protein n=1 Tax=Brachionus calyciflorus TaxID=104777 RepID=A0A813W0Y9_9BILA|nr:unnamed protein product [Brachionus calyciflorus]